MIAVIDYIQKLLYDHEFVVVPNFGGFISRSKHAFYDQLNSHYLPMTKQVAFNESLKLDDGLLTQYIALNEQISTDEAQKRIKNFVDDIRAGLNAGSYQLGSIGLFSLNLEQRLVFEPTVNENFWKESYGFNPLAVSQHVGVAQTSSSALAGRAANSQVLVLEKADRYPVRAAKIKLKNVAFGLISALAAAVCIVGSLSYSPNERNAFFSSLNPLSSIRSVAHSFDKKAVPVVVPKPATIKIIPVKQESVIKANEPVPVLVKQASISPSASKPQTTDVVPRYLYTSDPDGSHHVIVGAFASAGNAEKCLRNMQKLGFRDTQILYPTNEGELVKVSVVASAAEDKAYRRAKKISLLTNTAAWVYNL